MNRYGEFLILLLLFVAGGVLGSALTYALIEQCM